jgi:hypothetical protein
VTLAGIIAEIESYSGQDWKYIREQWSWNHIDWKLKGYIEREERKREREGAKDQE